MLLPSKTQTVHQALIRAAGIADRTLCTWAVGLALALWVYRCSVVQCCASAALQVNTSFLKSSRRVRCTDSHRVPAEISQRCLAVCRDRPKLAISAWPLGLPPGIDKQRLVSSRQGLARQRTQDRAHPRPEAIHSGLRARARWSPAAARQGWCRPRQPATGQRRRSTPSRDAGGTRHVGLELGPGQESIIHLRDWPRSPRSALSD